MKVLITALRSMGLIHKDASGALSLSDEGRRTHLVPGGEFDMSDYLELARAEARGIKDLVVRLRTDTPAGSDGEGTEYIFDEGMKSAMQEDGRAQWLTERLAGRAKNTAAKLAKLVPLEGASLLLDVGGGTGIFQRRVPPGESAA